MSDSNRRKKLEEKLQKTISAAETQLSRDPQTKKLLQKVRKDFHNNQNEFLSAFAQPSPTKPGLPHSRIPDLLVVLDSIAKKQSTSPAPPKAKRTVFKAKSVQKTESQDPNWVYDKINEINTEIEKSQKLLSFLEEKSALIKSQTGQYKVPSTRLKAERYLRELPGRICYLQKLKSQLMEEHGISEG